MQVPIVTVVVGVSVCSVAAMASEPVLTTDVWQDAQRQFVTIFDEKAGLVPFSNLPRSAYWLAEVTPNAPNVLIGPVPGMLRARPSDSVASSWVIDEQEIKYLTLGRATQQSLTQLREFWRDQVGSDLFHVGQSIGRDDPMRLAGPIEFAEGMEMSAGFGPFATASSLMSDRTVAAIYHDDRGHLQVWERLKHVGPPEHEQTDAKAKEPVEDAQVRERDFLDQMAQNERLDPNWVVIGDMRLTIRPPMLLICTPEALHVVDNNGVAFVVEDGAITRVGTFPDWSAVDDRVLIRSQNNASLYGHRAGAWEILAFAPESPEQALLRASKVLTAEVVDNLDQLIKARDVLHGEMLVVTKAGESKPPAGKAPTTHPDAIGESGQ